MTPDNREAIARIEQCDRDAAADIYQRFRDHDMAGWCKRGKADADSIIQAFAKHRILATRGDRFAEGVEAAAKVADDAADNSGDRIGLFMAKALAAAIRSLKAPEAGG